MNIQDMTTEVRPRNRWEAIDLGFTMARQWFLPLWGLWLLTALPVFALVTALLPTSTYWAGLIVWWLKPLYEQAVLYYLSRSLFGDYPSFQHIRKQLWSIIKPQLIASLTLRRLSPSRSFNAPVAMLEQLKGERRRERLNVLHHSQNNVSQWLTLVSVHLEMVLYFSLFAVVLVLIPEEQEFFDWVDFMDGDNLPLQYVNNIVYFLAISLIAPFYVAAGFALYLTRRTELEAWDIELSFKKLQQRHRRGGSSYKSHTSTWAGIGLAGLLSLGIGYAPDSLALTKEESRTLIKQVMEHEDFGKLETYKTWEPLPDDQERDDSEKSFIEKLFEYLESLFEDRDVDREDSEALGTLLASLLKAVLYIGGGLLLLYLIWRFTHWLDWMGLPQFKTSQRRRPPPPTKLFGLEVNADTLPEDLLGEVRELLQKQQWRAAVALLYRASLIQLIHLHQLDIPESATEGECQRLVEQYRPDDEAHYFQRLTRQWLLLAYAHEQPQPTELSELCEQWPSFYQLQREAGHE